MRIWGHVIVLRDGRAFAWHTATLVLVSSISYGPWSMPGITPEGRARSNL